MNAYKRIVTLFLSFAMVFSLFVVPTSAVSADASAWLKSKFNDYLYNTYGVGTDGSDNFWHQLLKPATGECPHAWVHNADGVKYCEKCKQTWDAYLSSKYSATFGGAGGSRSAYTDYVNTLPGSQYGKDGKFGLTYHTTGAALLTHPDYDVLVDAKNYKVLYSPSVPFARFISSPSVGLIRECSPFLYWSIPIKTSGTYTFSIPPGLDGYGKGYPYFQLSQNGGKSWQNILGSYYNDVAQTTDFFCDASFQFRFFVLKKSIGLYDNSYYVLDPCPGKVPTVRFKDAGMGTPPNVKPNTRTGSLAGDFGYYDKSGKLIPVKNIHIVNETDNSIYNPVTNTTTNFTDWNYDYSTRTYTLTIDNSTTQTITYGDEYVTINQGDTVTNIYYVTPPPPTPSTCTHSYAPTVTTPPTCTLPGVRTQTCPKCKDSYTEPIPATGHSWAVKTTVQTVYDATGALVTQGYTVYKCSTCGEEYKDTGGTGPPGGIGGGGSADSGTGNIWDKLGSLLGTAATGFITVLKTAVVKILDAIVSLFEAINAKLASVTTAIFGLFDRIPQLFGGFSGFLAAVFPFLPVEVFDIVTLTILLLAAATLIKFFMKR